MGVWHNGPLHMNDQNSNLYPFALPLIQTDSDVLMCPHYGIKNFETGNGDPHYSSWYETYTESQYEGSTRYSD